MLVQFLGNNVLDHKVVSGHLYHRELKEAAIILKCKVNRCVKVIHCESRDLRFLVLGTILSECFVRELPVNKNWFVRQKVSSKFLAP